MWELSNRSSICYILSVASAYSTSGEGLAVVGSGICGSGAPNTPMSRPMVLGKEELWHKEGFQVCSRKAAGNWAVNAFCVPAWKQALQEH